MKKSALKWMVAMMALMLAMPLTGLAAAELYIRGDENVNKISISIDDCWEMSLITKYLDICAEYGVRTTLFPVGRAIKAEYADIWKRAVEEGHEIGNHTYSHPKLTDLSQAKVIEELQKMEKRLNDVLGFEYDIQLMRPPYGVTNGSNMNALEKAGYQYAVKWDVLMPVAAKDPAATVAKGVSNGSIILFHALKEDIACIADLIPLLLDAGYEIVPISELLGIAPAPQDEGL